MDALLYEVKGLKNEVVLGDFSFSPNGTSDPDAQYTTGILKEVISSITYSATGVYTVVFRSKFKFPSAPHFLVVPRPADLSGWFAAFQSGAYDNTTRTLVIQAHRSGTGNAVAASSGAGKIVVLAIGRNSQGR